MEERIKSFDEFWPHYLSEHRSPTSRKLHFLGTTGFIASAAAAAVVNPIGMGAAAIGFGALLRDGVRRGEAKSPSAKHIAAMIGLPTLASPALIPAGVVFAYGCAWIGHFGFEKNRPATFHYPLWSLASDFRMYGHMLRGRLWSGDPLEELGMRDPRAPVVVEDSIPETTIMA